MSNNNYINEKQPVQAQMFNEQQALNRMHPMQAQATILTEQQRFMYHQQQMFQHHPDARSSLGDVGMSDKMNMPSPSVFGPSRRRRLSIGSACTTLFIPWFLFCTVFVAMSFRLHYKSPDLAYAVVFGGYGLAAVSALVALRTMQRELDYTWYGVGAIACFLATCFGVIAGDLNFTYHMQPYYTIQDLNTYPEINPAQAKGSQLMDAGRVYFAHGTGIDSRRAMGFKNFDLYCVAPIVHGNEPMASYDFWAVGTNCCSGVAADFRCGDYNKPHARSGLRLLRDDTRPFYRLAVQQAEAAYHIKATHPLFFHWMEDPMSEVNAYHDDGLRYMMISVFAHFAFNMFVVVGTVAALISGSM